MAELKRQVLSGLRWSIGAKAGSQLITWTVTIIVMRLLQPDDYGLMAMAGFFVSLCLLLNEMGMAGAIIQAKTVTETLLRQVLGLVLLINGALFVLLIACSPLIATFFDESRLVSIVSVLAIQFLVISFSVVPSALLTRAMDFRARSLVELFSMVLSSFITLYLAWTGKGVWALVIGSISNIVLRTIGFNIARPSIHVPSFNFKGFGDRAKFGGYISLNRILWYLYSQADIFIVGKLLGKTVLGYYSVAMHVASLPMQKIGGILHQVALPAYSQLQDNRELAAQYALKASKAIAFVAFPVFFGISSVAPEIVQLALGDKWVNAILPLQLLSLVIPLRTVQISIGPALNGLGRPDVNVRNLIVACIVMPLAFFIGTRWGLLGVSLGWIIGYSIWFVYMLTKALPIIGISLGRFLGTLKTPAFYSAIMYGAVYLTKITLADTQTNEFLAVAAMVGVGAVVYAGCMFLLSRESCREVWRMIHN